MQGPRFALAPPPSQRVKVFQAQGSMLKAAIPVMLVTRLAVLTLVVLAAAPALSSPAISVPILDPVNPWIIEPSGDVGIVRNLTICATHSPPGVLPSCMMHLAPSLLSGC